MESTIEIARKEHFEYCEEICLMMEEAAKVRGTGIAKRSPSYLQEKMTEGKAVIALNDGSVAGFCYIETWDHGKYVANSGLIVNPKFRNTGLAKKIKARIFELSKEKYPEAKIFGITTSLAVMKINSDLGYKPVTFSELTIDESFWKGCQSCKNFDILTRTDRSHCLCTGMLYDPKAKALKSQKEKSQPKEVKLQRWEKFKRFIKLQKLKTRRRVLNNLKLNGAKRPPIQPI